MQVQVRDFAPSRIKNECRRVRAEHAIFVEGIIGRLNDMLIRLGDPPRRLEAKEADDEDGPKEVPPGGRLVI